MYMKHNPCSPIMKNCKLEGKVSQRAPLYTTLCYLQCLKCLIIQSHIFSLNNYEYFLCHQP